MKQNKLFLAASIAVLTSFAAISAHAIPASEIKALKQAVSDLPAPELAPKAAELVLKAKDQDKEDVALELVRAIVSRKPASAPAVVGAISKVAPEISAVVAAEATKLSMEQAGEIAKAAATAAPGQASAIAAAVSKAAPKQAVLVTKAVINSVPLTAGQTIESVVAAVPAAKIQFERDPSMTRISDSFANQGAPGGFIVTVPGTVKGQLPNQAPIALGPGTASPGRDDRRNYGTP